MIYTIPVSALRFEMKTAIEAVGEPDSYVLVTKHGKRVGAFVSLNMLDRMLNYEDMERYGRYDPASGLRERSAVWKASVHGNPETKWEPAPYKGEVWYGESQNKPSRNAQTDQNPVAFQFLSRLNFGKLFNRKGPPCQ